MDRLAERYHLRFKAGRGPYVYAKHIDRLLLVKPTTYMNESGRAVAAVRRFFNIDESQLLLVYDDLDLPLGTIRFRAFGSSGGHKGMDSVIQSLNTDRFPRLRIGISGRGNIRPAEKYVLKPFDRQDRDLVAEMIDRSADGLEHLLKHSISETMNSFNHKTDKTEESSI